MKHFKRLQIWQKGFQIAVYCYKFSKTLPTEQRFGIASQLQRAGFSVPSNIAEGSSRSSNKDYCRFLEIALGSLFELETQLMLTEALDIGDNNLRKHILSLVDEEQKMILAFQNRLKS